MTEIVYIGRMLLAAGLGAFVGFQRERDDKPAGVRTISMVTLGASLSAILTLALLEIVKGTGVSMDISRIPAYALAGIGFLGSGIIILKKKNQLEGSTTAATIWAMVPIGLLVGFGYYLLSVIPALLIFGILAFGRIKYRLIDENGKIHLRREE